MSYLILPKRVFNSPVIRIANFEDGTHVNLIKLNKPYKSGLAYAIHENTKSPFCSNGMYKTIDKAIEKFNLMVKNAQYITSLTELKDIKH